jgi:hypothetical protein
MSKNGSTAVALPEANHFVAYGDAVAARSIVGQLLRFRKGEYLAGEDNVVVKPGTLLVANMDELLFGWVKWVDRKPTEHVMGKVSEGYKPPLRRELGDTDDALWDEDAAGKPKDPWALSNYLLFMDEYGELYTFTTSSKTGLNAVAKLAKEYGSQLAAHPDHWPVVQLAVSSYEDRDFGRIPFPAFPLVGWFSKKDFPSPAEAVAGKKVKKKLQLRLPTSDDLNDEVPSFA